MMKIAGENSQELQGLKWAFKENNLNSINPIFSGTICIFKNQKASLSAEPPPLKPRWQKGSSAWAAQVILAEAASFKRICWDEYWKIRLVSSMQSLYL